MTALKCKHPYTGRPSRDYITVVFERHGSGEIEGDISQRKLIESMSEDKECELLRGWKVTAFGIGDELSEQEVREESE